MANENVVTRSYNLDALQAAGQMTPRETLAFGNLSVQMRSVTIDNASNCIVGLFLDRDPDSIANIKVPAGWVKTTPISARILGIAFSTPAGDIPRGTTYVHVTDERLAAASSPTAVSSGGLFIWDSSTWDGPAVLA